MCLFWVTKLFCMISCLLKLYYILYITFYLCFKCVTFLCAGTPRNAMKRSIKICLLYGKRKYLWIVFSFNWVMHGSMTLRHVIYLTRIVRSCMCVQRVLTGAKPVLGPNCMISYIKMVSYKQFGPKTGLAPVRMIIDLFPGLFFRPSREFVTPTKKSSFPMKGCKLRLR